VHPGQNNVRKSFSRLGKLKWQEDQNQGKIRRNAVKYSAVLLQNKETRMSLEAAAQRIFLEYHRRSFGGARRHWQ